MIAEDLALLLQELEDLWISSGFGMKSWDTRYNNLSAEENGIYQPYDIGLFQS